MSVASAQHSWTNCCLHLRQRSSQH